GALEGVAAYLHRCRGLAGRAPAALIGKVHRPVSFAGFLTRWRKSAFSPPGQEKPGVGCPNLCLGILLPKNQAIGSGSRSVAGVRRPVRCSHQSATRVVSGGTEATSVTSVAQAPQRNRTEASRVTSR